jgi:outer membrane protein assembly factor BamB
MSVSEVAAPPKKRSFLRIWLPLLILVAGSTTVAVMRFGPFPEWEAANRNVSVMFTVLITSALFLFWFVLFSGLRWVLRLAVVLVIAALAGGAVASVRNVAFTGDMLPIPEYRWQRPAQDVLRESREQSGGAEVLAPIELDTGQAWEGFREYRGLNRAGIAYSWLAWPRSKVPRLVWRQPVGGGYSGFAVAGNVAVTLEQRADEEVVVCYDSETGRERWRYAYPAHFSERLGGEGPRATPTISKGDVFSLGATGILVCLKGATGEPKWSVNILEGNANIIWGMAGSPLVYDNVVVVNPGAQKPTASGKALVAYDRTTGKPVWSAGSRRAGYSSPMLATFGGTPQVLLFDGEALGGFDAKTGKELWHFKWDETLNGINVAQPLVLDNDRVFISSGYGIGAAMVQVYRSGDRWGAKQVWKNKTMRCRFNNPVFRRSPISGETGYIYGLDEGFLVCLDPDTGLRQWRQGRYGHGQLLLAEGDDAYLVILSEDGHVVFVGPNPTSPNELARFPALEGKTWNCPALRGGRLFVRNHLEMACYDLGVVTRGEGGAW